MKGIVVDVLWFLLGVTVVSLVTALLYVTPLVYKIATLCDRNPALFRDCNK